MPDYQRMYHILCAAASAAVDELDRTDGRAQARRTLVEARAAAEELYLAGGAEGE